jgi:hypothetical protein
MHEIMEWRQNAVKELRLILRTTELKSGRGLLFDQATGTQNPSRDIINR